MPVFTSIRRRRKHHGNYRYPRRSSSSTNEESGWISLSLSLLLELSRKGNSFGSCWEALRMQSRTLSRRNRALLVIDSLAFLIVFLLFIMMTFQNRLSGIIVLLMRLLQAPSDPVQDFSQKLSSHNNFDFGLPSFITRPKHGIVET